MLRLLSEYQYSYFLPFYQECKQSQKIKHVFMFFSVCLYSTLFFQIWLKHSPIMQAMKSTVRIFCKSNYFANIQSYLMVT